MPEQTDHSPTDLDTRKPDDQPGSIEDARNHPYARTAALGLAAIELVAVLGGAPEAKASDPPAEPITVTIPAAENISDTQILLTGPPWGDEAGKWGSITPQGWYGLHVANERMHRPGEIGASFLGAHSNLMNNGKIDVGGNLIDDVEFPKRYPGVEDHALKVGDEGFIEMDDGTVVKQTVFDLREFIEEIPGLLHHLPDDQGVGIYTPKSGLWLNGVPEILETFAEEKGWAVTYLFTSYGGPNSDEWKEDAPNHRKHEGIIAMRSEVIEKPPTEIDTEKDQELATEDENEEQGPDFDNSTEVNDQTSDPEPEVQATDNAVDPEVSAAVLQRREEAQQALIEQIEARAEEVEKLERKEMIQKTGFAALGAIALIGGVAYGIHRTIRRKR